MDPFALNGRSIDTDLLIFRSLFAIDPNTNLPVSSQSLLSTDGQGGLQWQDAFTNMSTFSQRTGAGVGFLPSTLYTLSTGMYGLSNFVSKAAPDFLNLQTSLDSLAGRYGYISSPSLASTVDGLGSAGYVSTTGLLAISYSTLNSLYRTSAVSTNIGLGTFGYISSLSLQSTFKGLGTAGYVSTPSIQSTIQGLGTYAYISSLSLQSTITSLTSLQTSTVTGLGTSGYISSLSLQSTVSNLLQNITVNTAGSLIVANSKLTIGSVNGNISFSNVYNSSLTYKGMNGLITASTFNRDMYFSSANLQLSTFTNYIVNKSLLTADIFPNYIFCSMADPMSQFTTQLFTMSSFLAYKQNNILTTTNNSLLVASSYATPSGIGSSNSYQTPIRMSFKASDIPDLINGNVTAADDYVLMHRVVNSLSSNLTPGFRTSNIQMYMASTNSVFLSIQNNSL